MRSLPPRIIATAKKVIDEGDLPGPPSNPLRGRFYAPNGASRGERLTSKGEGPERLTDEA